MLLLLFLPSIEGLPYPSPCYYVQMPASVTVQEGLCITILCTFHHPPTTSSPAHGYWFKVGSETINSKPVATNNPRQKVQEEFRGRFHLVGDLLENNCTLRITETQKEDSGRYFFQIERGQQKFTYHNYHLDLKVTGSPYPPPPYYVQMPASVTVQEGLCITILCTFHHPPTTSSPAHGYWLKVGPSTDKDKPVATNDPGREVQEEFRGRFHLVGNLLENNCTLRITDARKEDSERYFFRIERGREKFSYVNYHLDLKVTDLTEKPVIYSPEPLEEGQRVTLVCFAPWICREGTPPSFSWTGAAVPPQQPSQNFSYFSGFSFVPKLQDHGSNLTCGMSFPGGGGRALTERTVQLSITSKTKPDFLTFTTGALLGSGVTAFLAFCLILTCVKFLRKKKQAEDGEIQVRKDMDCGNQVLEVPLDHQRDSRLPSPEPPTQSSPGEVYYATINFGRPKS